MEKVWRFKKEDRVLREAFAEGLGISSVTAQMLINRNVLTMNEAFVVVGELSWDELF